MRCLLLIAIGGLALSGCHHPRAVVLDGQRHPAVANLLLGVVPHPDRLAAEFPRSDWPAVAHGYRDDDVTFYMSTLYDEEIHFDDQGGLWHGIQTVRTGTWSP